jgi:hypothetical protein
MTRANLRPVAARSEDPASAFADQVRDAIAARDQRMEERYPEAHDLEARVVAAMHAELHGCAASVAGVEAPEHLREALRGLRPLKLGRHLCRLVLSPRPEAGRAVDAVLAILAEARGYRLEPLEVATAGDVFAAGVELMRESTDVSAALMEGLRDGRLDAAELERLKLEVREMDAARARLASQIAALEKRVSR